VVLLKSVLAVLSYDCSAVTQPSGWAVPAPEKLGLDQRVLRSRHTPLVRVTHWMATASFLALLVSGTEILISHPQFYWGEPET